MEPCPLDMMKRSLFTHPGFTGLCRRKSFHSTSAISAMPMGAPGWPDLAFWTASMERARMALASSKRTCIMNSSFRSNIVPDGGTHASAIDHLEPPGKGHHQRFRLGQVIEDLADRQEGTWRLGGTASPLFE